jgi:outer membrane protein OmpA-like peptidoglycan-associated protein
MTFRSLLLAGTVLPFAIALPGFALAESPSARTPWVLAQADAACPEGEVCPPLEGTEPTIEGTPPEEAQPAPEPAPPAEAAPLPDTIIEEAPQPEMETAPPEQVELPPEMPEQIEPLPEEAPPQPEMEMAPPDQVEPTPEMPEQIEPLPEEAPPQPEMETAPPEQVEPAPEMPEQIEPPPEEAPPPGEIGPQPEATPMPETTVEQQLEAQGDQEEAGRVRNLRDRLLEQFEQVIGPDGSPQDRRARPGFDGFDQDDVVDDRGDSVIIDLGGGQIYVQPVVPDDADRLLYGADNVEVQQLRGGRTRTIVYRRNGVQIITTRNRYGDILRRVKRLPDGTDIILYDDRFDDDDGDRRRPSILLDVRPPLIGIPEDEYIVDLGRADPDQIRGALLAPPVQQIERRYTLDEVLRNEPVRAYSPRIDLDTITFETGSATIGNDQMRSLFYLGQAMEEVLGEHPDEVYLIEGHTDAVGRNYDNLILSDRRAEAVAVALSQNFEIPPENLVTQGYGEQYLKVPTEDPDRRNRRATIRRLTDLLQSAQN